MKKIFELFVVRSTRRRVMFFILVLGLVFSLSIVMSVKIRNISRESCWDLLQSSTSSSEESISGTFSNFTTALDNFVNKQVLSVDLKSDEMVKNIQNIRIGKIAAPVRLYLSDGYIITEKNVYEDAWNLVDFFDIASDKTYLSQTHRDFENSDTYITELFVPVMRDGVIAGMSSVVIYTDVFSRSLTDMVFSGQAYILAVDRRDGMIFVDNDHLTATNIKDYKRKGENGEEDFSRFVDDVMAGKECRTTFYSERSGGLKYIYAVPSSLENVTVAVEVDEDIVFSRDIRIESIIWRVLTAEFIIFTLFIVWMLVDSAKQVEKSKQKKEREIKLIYEQDAFLYKKAVLNEAYSYFKANLTKNRLLPPIIERMNGEAVDYSAKIGNPLPDYTKLISICAEQYVSSEDSQGFIEFFNPLHLIDEFSKGNAMPQFVAKIHSPQIGWHYRRYIVYMLKDENTDEINAMIVAYDISEEIKHKKEEEELQIIIGTVSDDYESMALLNYADKNCIFYRLPVSVQGVDDIFAGPGDEAGKLARFAERFIFSEDRQKFCRDFSEASLSAGTENGKKFIQNYRVLVNGELVWFQFKVIQPETFKQNRLFLAATRDINDEVQAQMKYQLELEAALHEAKNANASKTQFLFNMSHDLRTPMNAVLGYADMVERNVNSPEKVEDYVQKLKSAGNQLTNIINDILEISRIESGQVLIAPAPYDMRNGARELKSVFTPLIEQKKQKMNVKINVRDYSAMVDYAHLYRIVFNVLSNAIKYTPEGGEITYSIEQLEDLPDGRMQCKWQISDTGRGMSKEYLKKIFERFSREKTTTESGIEGNGLGMALVKELVDKMSGTITVDSELGVGTTVTIVIPFERCSGPVKQIGVENDIISLKGMKVLLVEDIDLNREIACDMLENQGMKVTEAVNGQEAVDMIAASQPGDYDFVLMDIQMPVLDGYKATVKIRELENKELANIPIIAMTANAFAEDRQKAMAAGMNEHIPKPVKLDDLLTKVSNCLRNK